MKFKVVTVNLVKEGACWLLRGVSVLSSDKKSPAEWWQLREEALVNRTSSRQACMALGRLPQVGGSALLM